MASKDFEECIMKIIPTCIFNTQNPIIIGVEIIEGTANIGMKLLIESCDINSCSFANIIIGNITSIEFNSQDRQIAHMGDKIVIKIEGDPSIVYGEDFKSDDIIVGIFD